MNDIANWLGSNAQTIITVALQVIGVASLIAAATPNKTDNKIVDFIKKIVNFLAANFGHAKNKE